MLLEVREQAIPRTAKELGRQYSNCTAASARARYAGGVSVRASDLRLRYAALALESAQYGKHCRVRQRICKTSVDLHNGAGTVLPQHIHQIRFAHPLAPITIPIVIGSEIRRDIKSRTDRAAKEWNFR